MSQESSIQPGAPHRAHVQAPIQLPNPKLARYMTKTYAKAETVSPSLLPAEDGFLGSDFP